MKKNIPAAFFICTFAHLNICTFSQSVGIGTINPNPSAVLDVSSNNKGMLLPRMTTTQRNAIVSPAVGLTIFNLDDQCTDIFDGNNWIKNCGYKQGDSALVAANNWVQKADFGGNARYRAVGFSIGAKGYIGTGSDGSSNKKDFWEYDPGTNAWSQNADFGGVARDRAVGFSIGTKGYIGTGYDGSFRKDFWEYDPGTNTWTQRTDFGGTGRYEAVGFSIGAKGYIGTGYDGSFRKDFWEYDPGTNTWTQRTDFGGTGRYDAVGFSIGAKGYIGTGWDGSSERNDFWEYDPGANTWVQKTNFGGAGTESAVGFSIGTKGYIGLGSDGSLYRKDFWEYDPGTNTWTQKTNFQRAGRFAAIGFSIGTKGYIGTGYDGISARKDFWEYNTQSFNVASYTTASNTLSQSNLSDGIWTKTVLNEIVASGNKFLITKEGNVGIGENNPIFPLNFPNSTGDKISLFGNSGAHYGFGIQSALLQIHTDLSASDIVFGYGSSTAFTERMRIKGNGNVGIGTSTPNAPLQFANTGVNRKIVLYDANNNDHQFYGFGINTGTLRYQIAETGASHKFYAGATNSSSNLLFEINGLGNAWLGGTLFQASDARLKTNIHRIGKALQNLQQLNGYTYNWMAKDRDQSLQTGLLAQELQKVYPQLVKEDEKGTLSVNYSGMVPVLLEAIKEQQGQIEELKKENREIKEMLKLLLKK